MGKIIIEASSMSELASLFAQLSASAAPNMTVSVQPVIPSANFAGDHIGPTETDDEGPTNSNAPDTDKNGIRWDGRIHASTKALNADGTWRMARGIEKKIGADAVAAIEAELRSGAVAANVAAPQVPQPAAPVAPPQIPAPVPAAPTTAAPGMPEIPQNTVFAQPVIPPQAMPAPVEPVAAPVAPAPVQQPAAPVAPAPAGGQTMAFNEFMPLLGRMMQPHPANNHVYVDQPYLASLCQSLGVGNIVEISTQPEKIAQAIAKLQADQRWWTA